MLKFRKESKAKIIDDRQVLNKKDKGVVYRLEEDVISNNGIRTKQT